MKKLIMIICFTVFLTTSYGETYDSTDIDNQMQQIQQLQATVQQMQMELELSRIALEKAKIEMKMNYEYQARSIDYDAKLRERQVKRDGDVQIECVRNSLKVRNAWRRSSFFHPYLAAHGHNYYLGSGSYFGSYSHYGGNCCSNSSYRFRPYNRDYSVYRKTNNRLSSRNSNYNRSNHRYSKNSRTNPVRRSYAGSYDYPGDDTDYRFSSFEEADHYTLCHRRGQDRVDTRSLQEQFDDLLHAHD